MQDLNPGLGGALGMAFLGSLSVLVYRTALGATMPSGVAVGDLGAAGDSAGAGFGIADQLGGQDGQQLLEAVRSSLTTGTQIAYAVALTFIVAVMALALTRLRHVRLNTGPNDEAARD